MVIKHINVSPVLLIFYEHIEILLQPALNNLN